MSEEKTSEMYVLMRETGEYDAAVTDMIAVLPDRAEAERLQAVYERAADGIATPVTYWVSTGVPLYRTAEQALGL
ncbi:hypothetical protein [Nocardiopsis composta]|uniref:Uncharacterized protein n=1 Tax=Nocardiopsis composta TaxID=157465 RepID=A0A7W8VHJ8_9ACTN|nr:hypothetical protein [Nocardiopsis composta]MBB5436298.1 hypothetical protein [Nocardiopsis composta]